jgi:hypothetical protein
MDDDLEDQFIDTHVDGLLARQAAFSHCYALRHTRQFQISPVDLKFCEFRNRTVRLSNGFSRPAPTANILMGGTSAG